MIRIAAVGDVHVDKDVLGRYRPALEQLPERQPCSLQTQLRRGLSVNRWRPRKYHHGVEFPFPQIRERWCRHG